MTLKIKNIASKLSPEAQRWINDLSSGELWAVERVLNDVGEESFLRNWSAQKEQIDEARHLFGRMPY